MPSAPTNVAIIGGGPSLRGFDFDKLRGSDWFTLAINHSAERLPWVDAFFTIDTLTLADFEASLPASMARHAAVPRDYGTADAQNWCDRRSKSAGTTYYLRDDHADGLSEDRTTIHAGANSAYGALGWAYHQRPARIALLGIDFVPHGHWYGGPEGLCRIEQALPFWETAKPQLAEAGIEVINASPESAITCFERCRPDDLF